MAASRRTALPMAALLALLGGCALQSPPSRDALRSQALPHTPLPAQWQAGESVAATAAAAPDWVTSFDDAALNMLVTEALAHNADLQVAAARVEQAKLYVQLANAPLWPQAAAVAVGGKSGGGLDGLDGWSVRASLELDVWGRIRYGEAAAQAQSEAVQSDYRYARQSLAAMVVRSWFFAVETGLQIELAQEAERAGLLLRQVAQERQRVGIGNALAVAEADVAVGSYRDLLKQFELTHGQALRALELLLGRYPAAELKVAQNLAPPPAPLAAGVPAQLLERRPDLVAAELRVAAAFNRVGEAKAARLPRISLTAGASRVLSDLFVLDSNAPTFSFGGHLLAPLFTGGALQTQVEIRSAEQKQAVADYGRVVQRSFGEVENTLANEATLRQRDALLERNVADNQHALELAREQYRVGMIDLRVVQQRQLSLVTVRGNQLRVQAEALMQRANLHLVLGGSFEAGDSVALRPDTHAGGAGALGAGLRR